MAKRVWSVDEKKQIVLAGLKSEGSIGELCRRWGVHQTQYYRWKSLFIEGGTEALKNNGQLTSREANLQRENEELRQIIGDLTIENRLLKKIQK